MPFVIPQNFAPRVNEIDELLRKYEASVREDQKNELLRLALVTCCDLLSSLNLDELREKMKEVLRQADQQIPTWKTEIIGDPEHFEYFLNNVENRILEAANLKERVRSRVFSELRKARQLCLNRRSITDADDIYFSLFHLKHDICELKDEVIREAVEREKELERRRRHTKIVKTLCVAAIVFNTVGSMLFAPASVAACAASVAVGGAVQLLNQDDAPPPTRTMSA